MDTIFLSVVIPSYDEMANLRKGVLEKIEYFLHKKNYTYEVIVVDDGSTDGSVAFVEKFVREHKNFKLLKNSHLGKGGAVTAGMLSAKGTYALFTDMDQATPIEEIDKVLPFLEKGFDVVIGSRYGKRKGSPLSRQIISRGLIIFRTVIVGLVGISDTQCGFKAFRKEAAEEIFSKIQKFHHGFSKISGSAVKAGFDIELLYLARKLNYKIKEVPVEWLYVETRRVNPIKDSLDGIIDLFRIRFNATRGKYNKL